MADVCVCVYVWVREREVTMDLMAPRRGPSTPLTNLSSSFSPPAYPDAPTNTNSDFLQHLAAEGLSLAIIAGSAVLKVPQIMAILGSGNVVGLSLFALYFEVHNTLHMTSTRL